jgi:hypothetical protein
VEEEAAAEETVVFDETGETEETATETVFPGEENTNETEIPGTGVGDTASDDASPDSSGGFELVDEAVDEDTGDPELDELEAEIARELEG